MILRRYVVAILNGAFEVADLPCPALPIDELEGLAVRAWQRAGLTYERPAAREVAHRNGFRLIPRAPRGACGECQAGERIAYRWSPDEALTNLRVAHGLSHALLLRAGYVHSDTDAWLLTGCLVRTLDGKHETDAPAWFLTARNAQISLLKTLNPEFDFPYSANA